ncbi:hypothetical protein Tco_0085260 [Tanacetum coccineum]
MDDRGVGSCVVLGLAPLSFSSLVSPSVKLSVAGHGGAGKGGSRLLIPDLVVMTKVGASDSGVLLLLIAERIWEYCSRNSLRCHDEACIGTTLTRGGVVFAAAYRAQHIGRRHGGYRLAIMDTLGVTMLQVLDSLDLRRQGLACNRQFALHFWSTKHLERNNGDS